MAVSEEYLAKIRRGVRVGQSVDIDEELTDIIEECRRDLTLIGVDTSFATDESDPVILGAVRSFARWKFGLSGTDAELNKNDYMVMRDELRRRAEYCTLAT